MERTSHGKRLMMRRCGERGITMLEVTISMALMTASICALLSVMFTSHRVSDSSNDTTIAMNAVYNMIEQMRNYSDFESVYAYYNSNASDDPGGSGTAPGCNFTVSGLTAKSGDSDGRPGKIVFPEATIGTGLNLAENVSNSQMGMPRDLNGDGVIDAVSHSTDYIMLPVRVEVEWQGSEGDRKVSAHTFFQRR